MALLPNPYASSVVTPNAQGVSTPPDGGNVSSVNTPPNQIQTPAAAGMGGAAPQQQAPPPSPQQQAQAAQVIHAAKTGSAWNALGRLFEGSSTQYQQGPNGPIPVQVPNKPGQLFSSILKG